MVSLWCALLAKLFAHEPLKPSTSNQGSPKAEGADGQDKSATEHVGSKIQEPEPKKIDLAEAEFQKRNACIVVIKQVQRPVRNRARTAIITMLSGLLLLLSISQVWSNLQQAARQDFNEYVNSVEQVNQSWAVVWRAGGRSHPMPRTSPSPTPPPEVPETPSS
eukprot:12415430-Karenia_brevis.AAC.1